MVLTVSNPSTDLNDKIDTAVKILGKSKDRLKFFIAVYTTQKQIKTQEDIMAFTNFTDPVRILQEAKKLSSHDIIEIVIDPTTRKKAFKKIDFYTQNRDKIISLVKNPKKLEQLPTKTRPKVKVEVKIKGINNQLFSIMPISVDDIDSFKKIRKIKKMQRINPLEKTTKELIKEIFGDSGIFTDWGGETDDLFSTKLIIKGKRYHVAFGLKGRGTKGELIPKKMGKNGDQIQRLFRSPAQIFLVQYNGQINESILEQMKEFSIAKSAKENRKIFYGIIDGDDTARIFKAYSKK